MILAMGGALMALFFAIAYVLGRRAEHGKRKSRTAAPISDAGIREMIAEGRIEEAIQVYCQFTGMDRFSARQAIEDMQREVRLSADTVEHVEDLLRRGEKAGAIEAYQASTGASLAEALDYVEDLENQRR